MFQFVVSVAVTVSLFLPCITAIGYGDGPRDLTDNEASVLILGGGPAGIKAANEMIAGGFEDIIILEGQDQLRGSLAPIVFDGKRFAPGSLWAHTPDESDGTSYKDTTNLYESMKIRNDQGEDVTADAIQSRVALADAKDALNEIGDAINDKERADVSQKAALARAGWVASTDIDKALEWYKFDFHSGVSTRDSSTAGPARQRDVLEHQEYFLLDDATVGDPLLAEAESLLQPGHVRFGKVAAYVDYTDPITVTVVTTDGTEYSGHFLVVAHTVGVLQQGDIIFNPPLPDWKLEEIHRAQMGTVDPIFMKFNAKFWDDERVILHATDRAGYYPAFMNLEAEGLHPNGTNILVGFLTGDEAYRAELLDDNQVQDEILEVLRGMYGADNVPEPTEFYMSRFATDPLLRGTFATWPIGNIPHDAMLRLAARVGRVYFALEDASSEYIGIPYGAVRSGEKAGMAINACYKYAECPAYVPVDDIPCDNEEPTNPGKNPKKARKDFSWNH